jgi:hypothetical protein
MKHPASIPQRQRGAATLVVVMVLFFIISLVAAYTSRNLIFEQRTSTNQYRSTQALEVADAGQEWVLAMLNHGVITNTCGNSADPNDTSFRERYLNVDATTGLITPRTIAGGADLTPTCVLTPAGWNCSCPTNAAPVLAVPAAAGVWPAFTVRFRAVDGLPATPTIPRQAGVVRVEVVACTVLDVGAANACLAFNSRGTANEGRARLVSVVALTGNPAGAPKAALTARGPVALGATAAMVVANTLPSGLGITVHSGDSIDHVTGLTLKTAPGSPSDSSFIPNDTRFALPATGPFSIEDRMFASVFSIRPEAFRTQPAALQLACPLAGCTAAAVRAAISLNPWRPLWLTGKLNVDSAGDIGSATEPVVIVVNGDLEFTTGGVTIYGVVYNRLLPAGSGDTEWTTTGSGQVTGAVVAEGGVGGAGAVTVAYDADVIRRIRFNNGSFVRVPSSWRDYQ